MKNEIPTVNAMGYVIEGFYLYHILDQPVFQIEGKAVKIKVTGQYKECKKCQEKTMINRFTYSFPLPKRGLIFQVRATTVKTRVSSTELFKIE